MANKHGDFIWYELLTTDADAAHEFYTSLFGWTVKDSGEQDADYRTLAAADGEIGGLMQLTYDMTAAGARPMWLGYIAVEDVDRTLAAIVESGGTIHKAAWDIQNVGRLAMVADPQGAPFYVMSGTSDVDSHAFADERSRLGRCAWHELATSDRPGAMQFYGDLFGWRKNGAMDLGSMGPYEFLRRAAVDGMFAGIMTKPQETPLSLWTYYFRVADVDEAVQRAKAGGGRIIVEPEEIPGGQFSVNAVDPQGALFAFVGPRK